MLPNYRFKQMTFSCESVLNYNQIAIKTQTRVFNENNFFWQIRVISKVFFHSLRRYQE